MFRLYLTLGSLLLLAATIALLIAEPFGRRSESQLQFAVRGSDNAGSVHLDWDAASPVVEAADAASLEVIDGGVPLRYDIEKKVLGQGGLEYRRRSDQVVLTLTLMRAGQPLRQSSIRLTGRTAPAQPLALP